MRRLLRPAVIVAALWLAPAMLAMASHIGQARLHGDGMPPLRDLLFTGGDWFVYALFVPPIFAIARRWPITRERIRARVLFHLGMSLVFCVAWAVAGKLLQLAIGLFVDPRALEQGLAPRDWISWIFTTLPFGAVVYLCMAGVALAIQYFVEARDREVQVARLSEQLAGARFAALEAQVNPHFLFNTLNTIAVRARDGDTAGTVTMVEQLSDMLRRTLTRHRSSEVPLREELDLVRQYIGIEQARFSDRLRPSFEIAPDALDAAVPSFALQHLVENAIRHGIAKRTGAGRLAITARRAGAFLELGVEDDGAGVAADLDMPAGRGLANTRERLSSLYGGAASLAVERTASGGTMATLRLPYRAIAREEDDHAD
ncbi:MAG TPA: histidine kinase [Vicinamibacterales bacterium]